MTKLLPSSGFAVLSTHKDAVRYAGRMSKAGCTVTIKQQADGRYRVSFWPKN